MAEGPPPPGSIVWRDLTVSNAEEVRDFYTAVTGWTASDHPMGDYVDYDITRSDGEVIAGICHQRGENADIPPQWLMYVQVEDVAASAKRCAENGGKVVAGPRKMGAHTFCVIQDPAGAVLGLIQG